MSPGASPPRPRGSSAAIVPFPPRPAAVARLADAVEAMPLAWLLPAALEKLHAAHQGAGDAARTTEDQHGLFFAMLALCRLLDAADYPWDLSDRRARP